MSLIDITSANSKMRCVVPAYYPNGFDFDDYAVEGMFDTEALTNAEDAMSADGIYHAGYVFNPTQHTVSLMPTSTAGFLIDDWWQAERTTISKFKCNITLIIPSINRQFNFVDGVVFTWNPAPRAGRVLQSRSAIFRFGSMTSSPI